MKSIQLFGSSEIRFVDHPERKYAFGIVAEDLAKVLEASSGKDLSRSVDEDWKGAHDVRGNAGSRSVIVIWEPGIYQVLAKSRKPKAKPFQKWLFEQVLPEIRETGSFQPQDQLTLTEEVALISQSLDLIFQNTCIKPELVSGLKLNAIKKACPAIADKLEDSRQLLVANTAQEFELLTPTEIGKRIGLSGQKVNKKLIEMGFQIKNENKKSKKEPDYLPIGSGKEFSDLTLASGKENDSSSYQQLRWYSSVVTQF